MVAALVAAGLVVPAQGAAAQDCTTTYVTTLVDESPLFVTGPGPYPIIERDPQTGSITIHPQNVVPAAQLLAGNAVSFVQAVPGATLTYVDCVV
ncbi:MAG: hypothetical protein M3279_04495 [Actinomycetota bacterium]|nr:hypothetical protein [Actinomycetota bacterium]